MDTTTGWIVVLVILGIYFLPTIVAGRHHNSARFFFLISYWAGHSSDG